MGVKARLITGDDYVWGVRLRPKWAFDFELGVIQCSYSWLPPVVRVGQIDVSYLQDLFVGHHYSTNTSWTCELI